MISRRVLVFAVAALAICTLAVPLAAQTPSPTPTPAPLSPSATAAPGLTFPTLTPTPSATPNPIAPFAPFFLAAMLQGSDLPAGNIIELQFAAGPDDASQSFSDLDVQVSAGFLQEGGPILGSALTDILTGVAPIAAGTFIAATPADAIKVITAVRADPTNLIGNSADLSDVTMLSGPALGDESVEASAIYASTDEATGITTNLNAALVVVRRGRVFFLVGTVGDGSQQATVEGLAKALDAHVKAALPLLPAP